ncbi:MAG: hypothetical protein ABI036_09855 [Fibrobacteria bacterium]
MTDKGFRRMAPSHGAAAILGLMLLTGGENAYSYDSSNTVLDTIADTTVTVSALDPNSVAALKTTPAYSSCMASTAKKCDVCHVPEGDAGKANVLNLLKTLIPTHNGHHGDYVTTDHTCDLYKPKTTISISYHTVPRKAPAVP